ncbi:MAG: hypothetical protein DRI89_07890 [Bacteroidetes bacterium]|nr:MAG: hypothetical protein DRI89_07890 [Bacteroidota bacterium]
MKKSMQTLLVFLPIILICAVLPAQTVSFGYDLAGNRTSREVIYLQATNNLTGEESDSQLTETEEYVEMISDVRVTISPNPNRGQFEVKIEGKDSPTELYLHSLSGVLIFEEQEVGELTRIDISQRQNGTYILTLIIKGKKETWKIIKQ